MERLDTLFFALIRSIAVLMVLAYLLARIPAFGDVAGRRPTRRSRLLMALGFGLFSIYGTASGIEVFGALVNFRDLGPTVAGLLAGPLAGLGAGAIGGLYRYPLGGPTALPCALAPLLAGLLGGLLFRLRRGQPPRVGEAVAVMVLAELLHGLVTLLLLGTDAGVLAILAAALPPMLLANGLGIAILVFMINNIARERQTEAAKHRLDSELKIAHEIQMSMVPQPRPAAPGSDAEIHAAMRPAKEVGGDLYTFFPLADGRICLAVGDVAGKGVPASLYMAITQKLVKASARDAAGAAELVTRLNRELSDENEAMMFVTLFLALFDPQTGELRTANAGHNPPCLVGPAGVRFLSPAPGLALGIDGRFAYGEAVLHLAPGETLLLYTDGVTEAMDAGGNLYGEARLRAALERLRGLAPAALCEGLLADLGRHVSGAEQSDDITVLALRRPDTPGGAPGTNPPQGG